MLFNSEVFIFAFLPVALGLFFILRKFAQQFAIPWLVIASLIFYAYWKVDYLAVLLLSIAFNYAAYIFIRRSETNHKVKLLVTISVAINLGLLAYFKYSGFFINDVFQLGMLGFDAPVLPLAISFFTFQQIAFIVDEANRQDERVAFDEYAAFVTFFPQLIAGPIVRHSELIPQLKAPRTSGFLLAGAVMFSIGLAKKVLVADSFAVWASIGFSNADSLNFSDAWLASLSYTMQLYFDFSGYSDMAIGLGLLFGFKLPQNFNSPYKALSIQDFWRRWHITLSLWLRDYLYIPLGGNRLGPVRTHVNLFLTMLLGGLWHGAAWTFLLWGAMHGAALAVSRVWSGLQIPLPKIFSWTLTFLFVVFAWVFFRAASFQDGVAISQTMLGFGGFSIPVAWSDYLGGALTTLTGSEVQLQSNPSLIPTEAWLVIAIFLVVVTRTPNSHAITEKVTTGKGWAAWVGIGVVGALAVVSVKRLMETAVQSEFLYFQF